MTTADTKKKRTAGQIDVSELPKTLDGAKTELARLAREQEPLDGNRFRLHTANALYLAQKEFERRRRSAGQVEHKLPRPQRAKSIESLMRSDCFRRFCENQKTAEGMARLFQGEGGPMNALQQFGAAIRQVEREKSPRSMSPQPDAQTEAAPEGLALGGT